MIDPARAERLWLAMALATLLVVSVGIYDEEKWSISRQQPRCEPAHEQRDQSAAQDQPG